MLWFFIFFFISGFCSILYELVWLRLAMAAFGVTTPLVSIVLSVFMGGLGAGSWIAGALMRRYGNRITFPPLRLYACSELLIAASALAVPLQLAWGNHLLGRMADRVPISSGAYHLVSGAWLALTLVPWCACMGATIPLAMFAIRSSPDYDSRRSFSFLYLSNVLGAVAGATIPLFLIELYGFHGTLRIGALLNTLIFLSAFALTLASSQRSQAVAPARAEKPAAPIQSSAAILWLLFATGLTTMGMEVVWIRLFSIYIGPVVYSFARILAAYLVATYAGSQVYRLWSRRHTRESPLLWVSLAFFSLLALLAADGRLEIRGTLRVLLGVAPVAGVIGFLTPMLVDRWSAGDPDRAGRAYAVNIVGCILGPLVAGFFLLPWLGERISMLLLALPWFAMAIPPLIRAPRRLLQGATAGGFVVAALALFFLTEDYKVDYPERVEMRDSTATVIATGSGMEKQLLVNGVGMTSLTPVTKMMAHMTLASLAEPPRNVLIICFGMGTTFRSVISWNTPVTVVELVPSVPKLFTYYHSDGDQVLASPMGHVVIDDGRRYLERMPQQYDAIIIDPPPPVPAAGSSLLYSRDFYEVAKQRLRPGGILQQWLPPEGDATDQAAIARALMDVFPYVRVYGSVQVKGYHYLASMSPIPMRTAKEMVARMPAPAVADMIEWGPASTPVEQFDLMLSNWYAPLELIARSPDTPALQDDRPVNEYYLLRELFPPKRRVAASFH
ncbi:MAG: fused MFS/spermidine synthase [Candidatus Korobacteraceae bacterium]